MKFRRFQDPFPCFSLLVLLVAALLLGGCVRDGGTTTQGGATGLRELQIVFKDPGMPEVRYLQPNVTEIQLRTKDGQWITIWSDPAGKAVRLTPDGASVGFDTAMVPAGTYTGTRLKVSTIDVEVDVNRDGDTLDTNQQVVLTLDEFNALPPKEKPTPPTPATTPTTPAGTPTPGTTVPVTGIPSYTPGTPPTINPTTPTGTPPPGTPTPPTPPTTPTRPPTPTKPSAPSQQTGRIVGATAEEKPAKPSKPAEPSPPQEPTMPPEPTRPSQIPTREQHFEPQGTGGTEPSPPYTIVGDLVYLPVYLDEKHTVTLNDYIVPLGEDLWTIDFVYDGKGGSLVYDFTLHPLLPKGQQITVAVSFLPPPPEIPLELVSLGLSPDTLTPGASSTGTVTMNLVAAKGGQVVNLSASPAGSVVLPATVTVPEDSTTATFSISTRPVTTRTDVTITADIGRSRQTAQLTVNPALQPSLASLTLSPASVVNGDSPTGTVTLDMPAPAGGQLVMLSPAMGSPALTPDRIMVNPGATSASFRITTSIVNEPTNVTIAATLKGVRKTAQLTITTTPYLSAIEFRPSVVNGGTTAAGIVYLNSAAGMVAQPVQLSATPATSVTFPAVVIVNPGEKQASFNVTTRTVTAPTSVTFTATMNKAQRSTGLVITPQTTSAFDVTITDLNCLWTSTAGPGGVKTDCVRIVSNGTAKGPVGARLELPILAWSDDVFNCGSWTYSPGALIAVGGTCTRKTGQPETTSWYVDTGGNECPTRSYFANTRTHTVKIYQGNELTPKDTDSKTKGCTG